MSSEAYQSALLCPNRRVFLASAGAFVAWANIPRLAHAAVADPRLVVVILRGAMDGLAAVPPVGDPDYATLRQDLAVGTPAIGNVLPLDGFFAINDAMPKLHKRYHDGEALIVHATATPYRRRSHFDGQDVLENGTEAPKASDSGWLNRAVAALPTADDVRPVSGLATAPTVPLILRGPAPTLTWSPSNFRPTGSDTAERLIDLYAQIDPELASAFGAGMTVDELASDMSMDRTSGNRFERAYRSLASGAARLLADPEGPRIAALSYEGWDTHVNAGVDDGRTARLLTALDGALETLAAELGPTWNETVVAVVTEFGRTARENGADGTDHGTATATFLLGGAVNGGRIIADWPGLKPSQLHENRDLAPTTDLRAVMKGVLRDHLGLAETALATDIFPGSLGIRPLNDLIS